MAGLSHETGGGVSPFRAGNRLGESTSTKLNRGSHSFRARFQYGTPYRRFEFPNRLGHRPFPAGPMQTKSTVDRNIDIIPGQGA